MPFFVEIQGSCTGSRCFSDQASANQYFSLVVSGLEYLKDDVTNVTLMKTEDEEQWEVVFVRFHKGS